MTPAGVKWASAPRVGRPASRALACRHRSPGGRDFLASVESKRKGAQS